MNNINKKQNLKDKQNGAALNNSHINKNLITKVFKKAKINSLGINFYESSKSSGKHYIFDERTGIMIGVSNRDIASKQENCLNQKLKCKIFEYESIIFLIIYKTNLFEPQFGIFSNVYNQLNTILDLYKKSIKGVKTLITKEFGLFIMDLLRLIIDIRDGWISGSKIITTLMSLYSLFHRFKDIGARYEAQVYFLNDTTFDSLILTFSLIGVPKIILEIMKTFSEITGRKLFNSNFVLSIVSSLYDLFKRFITWMCETLPTCEPYLKIFETIIDYLFSTIVSYSKIKRVVELYSKYVAEANIILDPKFRSECEELHKKLKQDLSFREYIDNVDNKHFRTTWDGFNNNLMKYINNFDVSKRDEPICIILEGKPGCGKSVLMNNLVEFLVRMNLSVYVHSVPPTEGGKDFYDDYENQDVFVMDDVGQQGASQWRTIINFVAPVKFPLECAEAKKKNTKFFNSKYIICTTNKFTGLNNFTSTDCIAEPGALFRRAHVIKVSKNVEDFSKHLLNLSYFKYDFKGDETFKNEFLYHNKSESILPNIEGVSTKDSLVYVMTIFKHLIKTEEINRSNSVLSEEDFKDIEETLSFFEPQIKISDYLNVLREPFEYLNNGYIIFDEWYKNTKNRISNFVSGCMEHLVAFINPKDYSDYERILISKCPFRVLDILPTDDLSSVLVAFRKLILKYHPDKAQNDEDKSMCNLISQILIKARDSILNNKTFINEPQYFDELDVKDQWVLNTYDYLYSLPYRMKHYFYSLDANTKLMMSIFGIYMGTCVGLLIFGWMYGDSPKSIFNDNLVDKWEKQSTENKNWELGTTGIKDTPPTNIVTNAIKKCVRFVVGKRVNGEVFYSQAVVGGKFILLNSHTSADGATIDIYNTYEHFANNHKEQELVTIKKVMDYPAVDLCVYKLNNVSLTYRSPRLLFGHGIEEMNQSRVAYPFMFLISSLGIIPIVTGAHLNPNQEEVKYSAYGTHYEHRIKSGYITNVEGKGLCGSILVNPMGTIMGVHVAGDGVHGFVVTPSNDIILSIRDFLCKEADSLFDIDAKIIENFSGARLRYETGDVKTSMVSNNVPMIPTNLHRDVCDPMRKLIGTIHDDTINRYSQVDLEDKKINNRRPPNLTDDPLGKLKETSRKTFKMQGYVSDEELNYIGDCIDSILPNTFDDTSFDEAAFGDELASMAKDTSNGYGHVRQKEMFFDFENKELTDYGRKEIDDFRVRVLDNKPVLKDYLSREVFKVNELRNEEKSNKPRTIRVMPVTHIYWTKVICGALAKHFKKNMHETGICIGFNPYKDFHKLATNLKAGAIIGDADFGNWDGTLNARIMFEIFDRIKTRYRGQYSYILDFLATTIVRSMVLVGDEVYATTHGMPSGTWLTLLLNCLVNKAVTALTIFRNKDKANVSDFSNVISYVTGDDNVFATPSYLAEVFNLKTLKKTAESLGMTCTNGDKTEITTLGQDFVKLNYLKRHFRMHPILKKYMGCLSLSTIINTLQYYDGSKSYNEAMQGKINAVAVESYIHSSSLYYLICDFVRENCPDFNILSESRIINILDSNDGYKQILQDQGKNYSLL